MPTTVEFTLPWGLYHATPWDRNANEGAVEWPPSPWRILRALYAVWQNGRPDLPAGHVEPLLAALSSPPRFVVPDFTVAHTRHYFPGISHRVGARDTTKTFDTFVSTERDAALLIEWPVDLPTEERSVLADLLDALGYLGRAESLVEARLLEVSLDREDWLTPSTSGDDGGERVRLLAPQLPLDLAALIRAPAQVRADRLARPPATRWLSYAAPQAAPPVVGRRSKARSKRTAVRFSIVSSALPPRHAAVALGDLLRKAALRRFDHDATGRRSALLAGKDAAGHKQIGPHPHAHYLSLGLPGSPLLDSMVVWAPGGLDDDEVLALSRCRQLSGPKDVNVPGVSGRRLLLGVEALGSIDDIAPELIQPASTWRSATPYAPTRHRNGSIDRQLFDDVASELGHRGLPEPAHVELLRGNWLSYRRHRIGGTLRDAPRVFGLQVEFTEPVRGPLALGRLSHFGLGLFTPSVA